MNSPTWQADLVVLTADTNMRMAICGLLTRHESLQIRDITVEEPLVHPKHDPGCVRTSDMLLRPYAQTVHHALVMLDHEGSGCETVARAELERRIEDQLARNGWADRAAAIVIAPELEIWVWSDSPLVDEALGWQQQPRPLREHLQSQGLWSISRPKPERPKEALTWALRHVKKPRSSAIYRQLAQTVGIRRCSDPAFQKLRETLQNWFPPV